MPTSHNALRTIYKTAKDIERGTNGSIKEIVRVISEEYGLKQSSARALIDDLRHMFRGETYKRKLSIPDLMVVLKLFSEDGDMSVLDKALESVEAHISYLEAGNKKAKAKGFRAIVEKFKTQKRALELQKHAPLDSIPTIAGELDKRATKYAIGKLQDMRMQFKRLKRRPSGVIFGPQTQFKDYAFHNGGRTEIQFNIGREASDLFRYGLAFSFEPSRTLSEPDVLFNIVRRFNEVFRENPDALSDLTMWHYDEGGRSIFRSPGQIDPSLVRPGVFVFCGQLVPWADIDVDKVLDLFDRLLPIYLYVQFGQYELPQSDEPFQIRPGCPERVTRTKATPAQNLLDVSLRHNALQRALVKQLAAEHGEGNVGVEQGPNGRRVDVLVRASSEFWYFEIKTALSARGCIREAMGQLLEYAYWPGQPAPDRLIIVGEPELDVQAHKYLDVLRRRFSIPLEYRQLSLPIDADLPYPE